MLRFSRVYSGRNLMKIAINNRAVSSPPLPAAMSLSTIPVIDFQKYGLQINKPESVHRDDLKELGNKMCRALEDIGFCYLKNHGIPDEQVKEIMEVSKQFFCQSVEEKTKCIKRHGEDYGWIGLEKENLNLERSVGDYKEMYNVTPGCDTSPLWPANIPTFEKILRKFESACLDLTLRVFDVISVGLDLEDKDFLRRCHKLIGQKGNPTALRNLYYPAIPLDKEIKEGQVRCGEHSDYGTLTLLFQDLIGGLEVKIRDGEYIPATPIPGTIVVNIGELMQRWTADRLIATSMTRLRQNPIDGGMPWLRTGKTNAKSLKTVFTGYGIEYHPVTLTEGEISFMVYIRRHRILIPQDELSIRRDRQSFAIIVQPDSDTIVKCLDGSEKYKPIACIDYINKKFYEKF